MIIAISMGKVSILNNNLVIKRKYIEMCVHDSKENQPQRNYSELKLVFFSLFRSLSLSLSLFLYCSL